MEESKRERVGGGKEVLSPSLPNPTLSPFFLAHFSLRFPNYLKACYRLTTCIPSFPTFYGIYSTWASSTFGALLLISRNRFGSTNFSTAFRLWKCHFLSLPCLTDSPPPPPLPAPGKRERPFALLQTICSTICTSLTAHVDGAPPTSTPVQGLSSTKIPRSRCFELYNLFKNEGLQNLAFVFVTRPN